MTELINGITWVLIAPALGLNIFENVRIVIKAGTAHGSNKMTPKIRLNLINGCFMTMAVKIPKAICKVVADKVQIIVHIKTDVNVSRQVFMENIVVKVSKPVHSIKVAGGI